MDDSVSAPALFETTITPHRSLSPKGLRLVICAICGASALTTTLFFVLGAWPVIGFNGAEIALAIMMLRLNARAVRRSERICFTAHAASIVRTDVNGARHERHLDIAWLSVVLQERLARVPALLLHNRSATEEVATDLGEVEKRELANRMAAALHRFRHPVFDNPQLREQPATG